MTRAVRPSTPRARIVRYGRTGAVMRYLYNVRVRYAKAIDFYYRRNGDLSAGNVYTARVVTAKRNNDMMPYAVWPRAAGCKRTGRSFCRVFSKTVDFISNSSTTPPPSTVYAAHTYTKMSRKCFVDRNRTAGLGTLLLVRQIGNS